MAGNSAKAVEFFNGSKYMKAVLMEEAPDEGALCCLCGKPLHGLPFYTTEPRDFDVHLGCAEYYCFLIHGHGHGQEKSSPPTAPANHRYKHGISSNKQLTGFQYPWQPQPNVYSNAYHAQPLNFSYRPTPFSYHQYPSYSYGQHPNPWQPQPNVYGNAYHAQPMNFSVSYHQYPSYSYGQHPNPWQPQPNVYSNAYNAQPMNFSYRPTPIYHQYPSYSHGQPPNPSFPAPVSQSNDIYQPHGSGSGSASGCSSSINQQAAGNNQVSRPTKWGTSAAVMLGSSALSAFLQVLFGILLA